MKYIKIHITYTECTLVSQVVSQVTEMLATVITRKQ